ncbi:hypothetical protein BDV95DRAFT_612925 [Massariosphaeria phaeospora]|uniref:Piwi domain-containing protein n=1 Tax=Massariosphaeria phaeospora TaxID=100035 RepID=A0A7C8HYL4_9PLEO|nr:hypothetical protein BDV95DRAFT_612925 [Massariosphaeria phaeospora]
MASKLSGSTKRTVDNGFEEQPCIRCGNNEHDLLHCKNSGSTAGLAWKSFSARQVGYANTYVIGRKKEWNANRKKESEQQSSTQQETDVQALPPLETARPSQYRDASASLDPAGIAATNDLAEESNDSDTVNGLVKVQEVSVQEPVDTVLWPYAEIPEASSKNTGNVFSPSLHKSNARNSQYPVRKEFVKHTTQVLTNHFELKFKEDTRFYEYQVVNVPASKSRRKTRMIIKTVIQAWDFLRENQDYFTTDNINTIISWKPLHGALNAPAARSGTGNITSPFEWSPRPIADGNTRLSPGFRYMGEKSIADLQAYVNPSGTQGRADFNFDPIVTALNMVVSKSFSNQVFQLSSNKFFLKKGHNDLTGPRGICHALCTIRGYFYTVKPGMQKVLLNVNAATSAFFRPLTVDEFLRDPTFPLEDRERILRTLQVYIDPERLDVADVKDQDHVDYLNKPQNRIKKINNLGSMIGEPAMKFKKFIKVADDQWQEAANYTTVVDHLITTFGKRFNTNLKAVNVGDNEDPVWYPQEYLRILPYQIYKRLLPDNLTEGMLGHACHAAPTSRALVEVEGLEGLGINPVDGQQPFPGCTQIIIEPKMLQIPCARMPALSILYGATTDVKRPNEEEARWNLRGNTKFLESPGGALNYYFVTGPGLKDSNTSWIYQTAFQQQVKEYGVSTGATCYGEQTMLHQSTGHVDLTAEFKSTLKSLQQIKPGGNIAILLLAKRDIPAYSAFKDIVDRSLGLQSICLTEAPNLRGSQCKDVMGISQYMANIMMKANLKLAGRNHSSADRKTSNSQRTTNSVQQILESKLLQNTLILGADVTHPGSGSLIGCPSIAAVVGSVDDAGGKFLGSMRVQEKCKTEIIDDLEIMVKERVDAYRIHRKKFPTKILYYRDGVSASQYEEVKTTELPKIQAGFKKAGGSGKVLITAVVAVKRHHTRLYPISGTGAGNGNCKSGTLVDSAITSPYFSDFFLQSHHGLKGTAIPTHYFMLQNDLVLPETLLHELTYKLCYTYVRATTGVSYAPPAYYADRLCERGRCYLRHFFSPDRNSAHYKKYLQKKQELEDVDQPEISAMLSKLSLRAAQPGRRRPRKLDRHIELERTHRDNARVSVESYFLQEAKDYWNGKVEGEKNDRGAVGTGKGKGKEVETEEKETVEVTNPWHPALNRTMFWM